MPLTQNFDGYSTGNLNGQDGWSGSNSFQVTTVQAQSSPNSVVISTNSQTITKSFPSPSAKGSQRLYMFVAASGTQSSGILLRNQAATYLGNTAFLVSGGNFTLRLSTGGGNVDTANVASTGAWHYMDIDWDVATQKLGISLNGGTRVEQNADTTFTTVDSFQFLSYGAHSGAQYWDTLTPTPATFTPSPMMHMMQMAGGIV